MTTRKKQRSFRIAAALIILVIVGFLLIQQKQSTTYIRRDFLFADCFHTTCEVILYLPDTEDKSQWYQEIQEKLTGYHQLMDAYNGYEGIHNIYTINQNAGVQPVEVDPILFELLRFCLEEGEKNDYRTNIGFGRVTEIWKDVIGTGILMEEAVLKAAGEHVDPEKIILDEENMTVYLADPEMLLDVGAVAKGYAADLLAEYLTDRGITSACIILGGSSTKVIGEKKTDSQVKEWLVSIASPKDSSADTTQEYSFALMLPDGMSMVTSGNYRQEVLIDGVRYHHLIDPDTLYPAQGMASVTILCESCLLGDFLSTALFTVDLDQGVEILSRYENAEAFWVTSDDQIYYTEGLADYIWQQDKSD